MDPALQLCIDIIRLRIDALTSINCEDPREKNAILQELFELREALEELNYSLIML